VRPELLAVIARAPHVASYYDLSFQHASPTLLRRMRRFGGRADFLDLVERIRALDPAAGIRSNVIVGFPGETEDEFADLVAFLQEARLDAVGVFGYSDEDGTEAAGMAGKVAEDVVRSRVEQVTALVDELMAQRAEERIGEVVEVLVEAIEEMDDGRPIAVGRAAHQGPDDAQTMVLVEGMAVEVGDLLRAEVVDVDGVDLIGRPTARSAGLDA
jgi:tRNA A37 methylthiotransferase MiaB